MRAPSPPRSWVGTRGGGGSGACAVWGLTSRVHRGAGTLLVDPGAVVVRSGLSVGLGCGLWEVAGRGASRFGRGGLRHEGGGGGVGDRGGAPCWALPPPDLGWLGPNVVEDVLGESGPRCRRGAGLGLGLGFCCGLRLRRATGFGGCLAAVLGFGRAADAGLVGPWALAAAGLLAVGTGFGAHLGGFPRGLGGGVLDQDVVVVADQVVVVVEVVEPQAEMSPPRKPPRTPAPPVCPRTPAGNPPGDAEGRKAPVGHQPKPNPRTGTPLQANKRRRTDSRSTRSTAGTPCATQHDAPDAPARGAPT